MYKSAEDHSGTNIYHPPVGAPPTCVLNDVGLRHLVPPTADPAYEAAPDLGL